MTVADIHFNSLAGARTELEVRFADHQSYLSPGRRKLLRAILEIPEENYFLSSRDLAKKHGVNAATIVRSTQLLGYEKFADFAADLRRHFVKRITPFHAMQAATREKRPTQDRIRADVEKDAQNLNQFLATIDTTQLLEVARRITTARRIVVIAVDVAAFLAGTMAYMLRVQGFDAESPVGSAGNLWHSVGLLGPKDTVIAISFGRCLRDTVESAQRARALGAYTFAITDSDTSPLAQSCDAFLLASIASPLYTGSYVAPMAAVNSIVSASAHLHPKRTLQRLKRYEDEYTKGARWYSKGS